ncbi:DUF885 domain-containing protein [Paractinoplanes lichenicola]|uniref:DUF885 domain-containing protein n=1 Tax=Paractinoplanes lichenicola TaxID=2802976 RepID=A0ABS1VFY7_9ACTN|nr:DUF885 domain-containing protein [Actinoplanes lichenicola]MBL7253416.1 DUF885 domain-containing protein [Actinoplanes lichenicola]
MTQIFDLCDEYVRRAAELDPVDAGFLGVSVPEPGGAATDFGPDGHAARHELITSTLTRLAGLTPESPDDRLAAEHLRERLEAQRAWHEIGEPLRMVRVPFGLVNKLRVSTELLPRRNESDWRYLAARLAAVPGMLTGLRQSLTLGLSRGLPAARRQALALAGQAEDTVGAHDRLLAEHGDGPLAGELASAAAAAYRSYQDLARYLREDYAPKAAGADGVGAERYRVEARLSLGMALDAEEAYHWGWDELARIEAEMAAEAQQVKAGATVDEAIEILDATGSVDGEDAYLAWLLAKHEQTMNDLDGAHFDIPPPLRALAVRLARDSSSGSPYYTEPSEDLSRPGGTWWPVAGRRRFAVWNELTAVFHEGIPGHHLQIGAMRLAGDRVSRFTRVYAVDGYTEGWGLYAERLADELGWFTEPGSRLGMLIGAARRAARVVIDIGAHLDLPLPDGSRWTFDTARDVLRDRARTADRRLTPEVLRYFGWPAQAISYKLGERAWLAARETASRRPGFDLKRWHTKALDLGPMGLDRLAAELG